MSNTTLNCPVVLKQLEEMSKDGIHVDVWKAIERFPNGDNLALFNDYRYEHGLNKAQVCKKKRDRNSNSLIGIHTFLRESDAKRSAAWVSGEPLYTYSIPVRRKELDRSIGVVVPITARLDQYVSGGPSEHVAVFKEVWAHLDRAYTVSHDDARVMVEKEREEDYARMHARAYREKMDAMLRFPAAPKKFNLKPGALNYIDLAGWPPLGSVSFDPAKGTFQMEPTPSKPLTADDLRAAAAILEKNAK